MFAAGTPKAQGSKRAFPRKGKDGRVHVALVEQNPGVKEWRNQVRAVAERAGRPVLDGPCGVDLIFYMRRPASHHVAGDRTRPLKASAPVLPHGRVGDLDKLTRAVLDALTGVLFVDDAQVCGFREGPFKLYGDEPGVEFDVFPMYASKPELA